MRGLACPRIIGKYHVYLGIYVVWRNKIENAQEMLAKPICTIRGYFLQELDHFLRRDIWNRSQDSMSGGESCCAAEPPHTNWIPWVIKSPRRFGAKRKPRSVSKPTKNLSFLDVPR